jgi:hypothetical protein
VPCGIAIAVPRGFEGQVRPRSGLAVRHGVTVLNAPGTIDGDYRGEVMVLLVNLGTEPFAVTRGMRIAQLVVAPVARTAVAEVAELDATERGVGGFGSTGTGALPFRYGWVSWGLGTIRPGAGTYEEYAYEELPPIPACDPEFRFLPPDERGESVDGFAEWLAEKQRRLANLLQEAQGLGLTIPDSFVSFMSSTRCDTVSEFDLGAGCWFNLSNRLVRLPGCEDGHLIGFLRDQQDCFVWCLFLTADGQNCVVAVNDDAAMTLTSGDYDALLGNLNEDEEHAPVEDENRHGADNAEIARRNTFICAESFESFIYRFWIENEIANKINNVDDVPRVALTEAEQRYLDHYIELHRLKQERLEHGDVRHITFFVTSRDRNRPAFVLDGRDYRDAAALEAAHEEAAAELSRRRVAGEWEYRRIGPHWPRSSYPSWNQFRAQLEAGAIDWLQ